MASNTIMMYFRVQTSHLDDNEFRDILLRLGGLCLEEECINTVQVELAHGDKLLVFSGESRSHATLHIYHNGLLTLDIHHLLKDSTKTSQYNLPHITSLHQKIKDFLGHYCSESKTLFAPIRLGLPVWSYMTSADDRIMEADYDNTVCDVKSAFQNITILHSNELGNVLHLDGDVMLGESDLIYTQTLCRIGTENYCDKEVLILGGGDGGILHELLKEKPKFITMAEIDEEVIRCCRTHMRSVCGSDMDTFEGANYKIVIDDCLNVLHQSINNNQLFDYVINDLTEFPVQKEINGYDYDFDTSSKITDLSLKALKPNGKLLARGNCVSGERYHSEFENHVKSLGCDVTRNDVYVPSFREKYCLYEISRKQDSHCK